MTINLFRSFYEAISEDLTIISNSYCEEICLYILRERNSVSV
jgi:hypothetical protein